MYEIIVGRDAEDRKKFGLNGTFMLGKHYVKMGQTTSLSNDVLMDFARSHVVFVTGKRGSGKCVTGDTLIALDDGNLRPIAELEEDGAGVVSLNKDLKTVTSQKSAFFKRSVKTILKVTTRSGRTIKLTPEHPLLSLLGWRNADSFEVGERIATPRALPNFGSKTMPESHIKLLAYLIAEGHLVQGVLFSNTDPAIVTDFSTSAREFDSNIEVALLKEGCYRLYTRKFTPGLDLEQPAGARFNNGQLTSLAIRSKTPIRAFLESHGLSKKLSAEKEIPLRVMQLQKQFLALFLNRLFSCDGSIYNARGKGKDCWEVSYSTISQKMAVQIRHLLLRFGILSKLRSRKVKCNGKLFDSYELVLNGENVAKFVSEIGFFGKKRLKMLQEIEYALKTIRNPNTDTIPIEIWKIYHPKNWAAIGRDVGYKHPKAMRERMHCAPSRDTLLEIAATDKNEFLYNLATSDIFWDEIVEIERLEGKFEVYDLTVPKLHNFVANDIIIHNSYTMASIAEGMMTSSPEVTSRLSVVMFDTMGIYWTMKYENKRDEALLREWGLKYSGLNLKVYVPSGHFADAKEKGIPVDAAFSIKPSELSVTDWCSTFNVEIVSPIGALIGRIVSNLNGNYGIDDIIDAINSDERSDHYTQAAAENLFLTAKSWGLFSREGISFSELVVQGQISVIDVSGYASAINRASVRALVIGLVSKKLFSERMIARKAEEYRSVKSFTRLVEQEEEGKEVPLIWIMVDEAHEFLPKQGLTPATDALQTLLREGRQPGISLVLASQQPGQIHTDVMTQSDIVIAHHITAKIDIDSLGALMQSYMREGLDVALANRPDVKGAAILFDDTNERLYPIRVRPRITWHGGSSPTLLKEEKKFMEV